MIKQDHLHQISFEYHIREIKTFFNLRQNSIFYEQKPITRDDLDQPMSAIYVYPELETIFILMPKCGGQSIQSYFDCLTKSKKQFHGHIPEKYQSYWKFTIVRNPADRLISAWTYCQKMKWFPKPRILPRWKNSSSRQQFLKLLERWKDRPVSPINFREFREITNLCRYTTLPQ